MDSKHTAIQVVILGYSMFGIIGLSSRFFSSSPITYAIGSSLTIFSYSTIAILSKKLTFKELFTTLIPLNIINALSSYVTMGFTYIKYQPFFDMVFEYGDVFINATKHNTTVPGLKEYFNTTEKQILPKFEIPYLNSINQFFNEIPIWVYLILGVLIIIWVLADIIISFISDLFFWISYPLITLGIAFLIIYSDTPASLIYFLPKIWIPIASTVDSFLRIYVLRALFFRFFKNHPLVKQYV